MRPQDSVANTAHQIARVRAETGLANTHAPFHASWDTLAAYRTPDWFRDAKFGIFLHWGVYSVPAFGNEWYSRNMYVPGNAAFEHHIATYGDQAKFIERGKLDTLRLLPWETDTSVSIHSWGYADHDEYRSAKSLIHQLVDTVAKNGNLLLHVGPKADGTIPEEAREVLLQMGAWLRVNGQAIYGTRPFTVFGEGPTKGHGDSTQKNKDIQFYTAQDIRYTTSKSGSTLYATALGWPSGGSLTLHTLYSGNPYLSGPVCGVTLLGTGQSIAFEQRTDGLHLMLPSAAPTGLADDIAYVFVKPKVCTATTLAR
jgi:Alpha-L-fucosidase/Alpha-L-fucosidase C-terminal domain